MQSRWQEEKTNRKIREGVEENTSREEEKTEISVWDCTTPRLFSIKRKCIQHHSLAIEETEIEKGKSEFAHLGKTSHWRQSISNSVLLKRARWKYSSSQHKRSWHTFQSIGYSQCAGKFTLKSICLNLEIWRDGDAQHSSVKSYNQSGEIKLSSIINSA